MDACIRNRVRISFRACLCMGVRTCVRLGVLRNLRDFKDLKAPKPLHSLNALQNLPGKDTIFPPIREYTYF